MYVVGSDQEVDKNQWRIEKRDLTSGALVTAFDTNGVVQSNPSASLDRPFALAIDSSALYVVGLDREPGNAQWRIEKRDLTTGALVSAFGSDGVVQSNPGTSADRPFALAIDASAIYVVGMESEGVNSQWRIEKRWK